MKWNDLGRFVETWATAHGLESDLKGRQLEMVDFESEEDCRFFYADRDLLSHQAFTNSLARWARARGAVTRRVVIRPDHYRAWLASVGGDDSTAEREKFIESRYVVRSA